MTSMKTYTYSLLATSIVLCGLTLVVPLRAQDSYLSEEDIFNEEVDGAANVYDPL